jgi:hypothetical protein
MQFGKKKFVPFDAFIRQLWSMYRHSELDNLELWNSCTLESYNTIHTQAARGAQLTRPRLLKVRESIGKVCVCS